MRNYRRPELAKTVANDLTGSTFLSDAQNGLFLAAPRRTGKTEFLKHDLKPELEKRGLLVMYVDLWSDKKRSPSDLIADELAEAMDSTLGVVAKTAKKTGLRAVKVLGTLEIDLSKIGKIDGLTLPQALQILQKAVDKQIVLIVDEAQHALTTPEGENAMSALKSARDQLRNENGAQLLLVMSGSHRDKLLRLVNTAAAAFWGSQVQPLPTLGEPFAHYIGDQLRQQLGFERLTDEALCRAFKDVGERPQFFIKEISAALQHCKEQHSVNPADFNQALLTATTQTQARDREALTEQFKLLPIEQRVILWRVLEHGTEYRAFDSSSLNFYESQLGKRLSAVQVQRHLDKLRETAPPVIWKSNRGDYSLYDRAQQAWYAYLQNAQTWAALF